MVLQRAVDVIIKEYRKSCSDSEKEDFQWLFKLKYAINIDTCVTQCYRCQYMLSLTLKLFPVEGLS